MLDARHAGLIGAAGDVLARDGWALLQEVTYSFNGERGSIDLTGLRPAERIVIIHEIKSEIYSWEETQRRFDQKVRLLPRIIFERFGWRPRLIAQVIVLDETMTNRRRIKLLGAAVRCRPGPAAPS